MRLAFPSHRVPYRVPYGVPADRVAARRPGAARPAPAAAAGGPPAARPEHVDVLVVGAGPAGLALATTLGHHGVTCLVVDRHATVWPVPRATVASTRTMELLRAWGLEAEIRAGGHDLDVQQVVCRTLADVADGAVSPVGYPTRAQSALVSPTSPLCVPQDHVEGVLVRHLAGLPSVQLARSTTLVSVALGGGPDGGARAVLRDAAGRSRTVQARHLVGADGARSTVREALGIPMAATLGDHAGINVVVHAPLWDVVGDHRHALYAVTHPDAPCVVFPAGPPDRWILAVGWPVGAGGNTAPRIERPAHLDDAELVRILRVAADDPVLAPRIGRVGTYVFSAGVAATWRHGPAFLVGDAAHRVTPRGGTGMNTAVHGAFDLGWKLAWVARGWADPALLDTYEREHRPYVEHGLARSLDPAGTVRPPATELPVDLHGRIPHVRLGAGASSSLDELGPGLTVLTGPDGGTWAAAAAAGGAAVPVAVRTLDAVPARALGIAASGALLVRPDGVAAGGWADATDAGPRLAAAVDTVVRPGPASDRRAVA